MQKQSEYRLETKGGARVCLSAYGASIREVLMPDHTGAFANVALAANGRCDPSYAGATLAPWAGRIPDAALDVDGTRWQLSPNEGGNQLHGGEHNLSRQTWRFLGYQEGAGWQEALFSTEAPDGLDGYPGHRRFQAAYRLWDENRLDVRLWAESDRPTRVNLSNHAYWNLSGDLRQSIDSHLLSVNADAVYINNEQHLAIGLASTLCPPFNFRSPRPISDPAECGDPQLALAGGLNHAFVLRHAANEPAATLTDPVSGRRLRMYTDQPCMVVYAGGYLAPPRSAVALEAQEHPILAGASSAPLLLPGQTYRRIISWCFDTVVPFT